MTSEAALASIFRSLPCALKKWWLFHSSSSVWYPPPSCYTAPPWPLSIFHVLQLCDLHLRVHIFRHSLRPTIDLDTDQFWWWELYSFTQWVHSFIFPTVPSEAVSCQRPLLESCLPRSLCNHFCLTVPGTRLPFYFTVASGTSVCPSLILSHHFLCCFWKCLVNTVTPFNYCYHRLWLWALCREPMPGGRSVPASSRCSSLSSSPCQP